MKYVLGSIFASIILVSGCGQQGGTGTGGNIPTPRIPEGLDERHAANFLSSAKDFREDGDSEQALRVLNELLEKYPNTDAAEEAKKILTELDQQYPDNAGTD